MKRASFGLFAVFMLGLGVSLAFIGVRAASEYLILRFVLLGAGLAFAGYGLRSLLGVLRGRVPQWFSDLIYMESS